MTSGRDGALDDIRVVEWASGIAAGYAAKMLADLGAQVHRVQMHVDHDVRKTPECEAYLDERKTQVAMGPLPLMPRAKTPDHAAGAADTLDAIAVLAAADILITDLGRAERIAAGIDHATLRDINPRLIQVVISPFGLTGPYRDYKASDLEVAFLSGLALLTPRDVPRTSDPVPPLKMPGSLVSMYAGASAAGAALTALHERGRGGAPHVVDVSMLESLIPTLRREIALFHYEGQVASRFMRVWRLAPWGVKPCSDGYVFLQVVESYHWQGVADMMGNPEWSRDPRYLDADYRFEHRVDIEQRMGPWLLTQQKAAFAWESQRRGLPFAPVNDVANLIRIPQLHHRHFFRCATAVDGRALVVPGIPFVYSRGSADAAPGIAPTRSPRTPDATDATSRPGPLSGLRVIDFGHVWAGPYCAAVLGDMGAEVIKIESQHRLDVHRRQGPYPERKAGMNRSGVWNSQNRGKRSATFNLSTERGRDLVRDLVAQSDVVIENFAPGVMARLGLGYEALRAVQPDIVMASLSAFGQDGPQSTFVGYGPSLDAWAGLDSLTAHRGGEPNALGGIFPDTGSGLHAVVAILAALHARDRGAGGRYIDLSELEVSILLLADLATEALAGHPVVPAGNTHPCLYPYGCFRCAGDDEWIALHVDDAAGWTGLCRVLARDDWAGVPSMATSEGRREHTVEIDAAIGAWAIELPSDAAMRTLQAHGVAAAAARSAATLIDDEHLRARRFFRSPPHAEAGAMPVYGPIWRLTEQAPDISPAPLLGQDNDYVFQRVLGLDANAFTDLVAAKIIY